MRWRSCPQDECIWVPFDDEFVVFHKPSGKTHFLNAASEVLIREVLDEPRDFSDVLEFFGSEVAGEDASAYRKQMKEMLSRLEHLGLIKNA